MNNLYDILEICLKEIENGADVDTVLFRYPEFAEELRPILETSMQAKMLAAADPSPDVVRRSRANVMPRCVKSSSHHPAGFGRFLCGGQWFLWP